MNIINYTILTHFYCRIEICYNIGGNKLCLIKWYFLLRPIAFRKKKKKPLNDQSADSGTTRFPPRRALNLRPRYRNVFNFRLNRDLDFVRSAIEPRDGRGSETLTPRPPVFAVKRLRANTAVGRRRRRAGVCVCV